MLNLHTYGRGQPSLWESWFLPLVFTVSFFWSLPKACYYRWGWGHKLTSKSRASLLYWQYKLNSNLMKIHSYVIFITFILLQVILILVSLKIQDVAFSNWQVWWCKDRCLCYTCPVYECRLIIKLIKIYSVDSATNNL